MVVLLLLLRHDFRGGPDAAAASRFSVVAYLGHTCGILVAYLGHTWGILGAYLGHAWGILGAYLGRPSELLKVPPHGPLWLIIAPGLHYPP